MTERSRMTGPEFREALRMIPMAPDDFSRLIGAPERRVLQGLHDKENIPPWVRGYCAALTVPESKALALASHREACATFDARVGR